MSNFDVLRNKEIDQEILPKTSIITSSRAREKVKKMEAKLNEIQQRKLI